jgi:hypothetical protein
MVSRGSRRGWGIIRESLYREGREGGKRELGSLESPHRRN